MRVLFLVLLALMLGGAGSASLAQSASVDLRDRAKQIAVRLELPRGPVVAAQRHLLIARLNLSLQQGQWDAASATQFAAWQAALDGLSAERSPVGLPVWPELTSVDLANVILDGEQIVPVSSFTLAAQSERQLVETSLNLLTEDPRGRLTAAVYPALLSWASHHAIDIWAELLALLEQSGELTPLVTALLLDWLPLPIDSSLDDWQSLDDPAAQLLSRPAPSATAVLNDQVAIVASSRLLVGQRLAATDLMLARLGAQDRSEQTIVTVANAVRQLPNGGFVSLLTALQGLIVAGDVNLAQTAEVLGAALVVLDPLLLSQLEQIDPLLLSSYQQTRLLLRELGSAAELDTERQRNLRLRAAQLIADVQLDLGDVQNYLGQGLRRSIDQEITICLGLTPQAPPLPQAPISAAQYRRCVTALANAANQFAATPELAGAVSTSWEPVQLAREAVLPAWQRINYWLAYLNRELDCELPTDLANPVEWALSASALRRVVDRWPSYAREVSPIAAIDRVIAEGQSLLALPQQLAACGQRGPILEMLSRYGEALSRTEAAMVSGTTMLREAMLASGADIELGLPATQSTTFRPVEAVVGPCGGAASCGMRDELEASPALFGLFDNELLVAHQIGAGELQLCYDNVRWVDRRAEVPQVRQPAMANYFGRLAFDLHGRMSGVEEDLFALRLTSTGEYEYLFGGNTQEVLSDACPRHLIDSQVLGELPKRGIQLVPRRLTYVTAERTSPARVFSQHWADGEQWREALVAGRGVVELSSSDANQYVGALNTRLAELSRQWDSALYGWLLYDDPMNPDENAEILSQSSRELDVYKAISSKVARLAAPRSVSNSASVRASLRGAEQLLDREQILRFRGAQLPADALIPLSRSQYGDAVTAWGLSRGSASEEVDPLIAAGLLELQALRRRISLMPQR